MPPGLKYHGTLLICFVLAVILAASFLVPIDANLRLWTGVPWVISLGLLSVWPNHLLYDRYTGGIEFWPGIWKIQKISGRLKGEGEVHLIALDGQFDGDNSRKRHFNVLIVSKQAPPVKLPPVYCYEHEAWNLADGIARAFGVSLIQATVSQIRK